MIMNIYYLKNIIFKQCKTYFYKNKNSKNKCMIILNNTEETNNMINLMI